MTMRHALAIRAGFTALFAAIVAGYSVTHLNEVTMSNGLKPGIGIDQWLQLVSERGWLWTPALPAHALDTPTLLLAHGAGAPMDSDFMNRMAADLAAQGISVLRFEFPYMAQRRQGGSKRPPNPQAQLLECWRGVHLYACSHRRASGGGRQVNGRADGQPDRR